MASTTTRPVTHSIYLLPLTDGGAPDVPGTYIYLPAPSEPAYSIRFTISGTSSICRHGTLWVNIPGKHEEFIRDNYKAYPLRALLRLITHKLR
jgi:glycogen debranching enzyme